MIVNNPVKTVDSFNDRFKPGDEVYYVKGDVEGAVKLKVKEPKQQEPQTDGPAYLFDLLHPVVELEHVGMVELRKVLPLVEKEGAESEPEKGVRIADYDLSKNARWFYIVSAFIFIVCTALFGFSEGHQTLILCLTTYFLALTFTMHAHMFPIWKRKTYSKRPVKNEC